jgi:hypothetical protein
MERLDPFMADNPVDVDQTSLRIYRLHPEIPFKRIASVVSPAAGIPITCSTARHCFLMIGLPP